MLDSSLIVAALGASRRTQRSRGDGQARPWAAPTGRNRRGAATPQEARTEAPDLDNALAEQVLTETTPRK